MHALNKTQIIYMSRNFGEELRDPPATLPVLLELPRRFKNLPRRHGARAGHAKLNFLAIILIEEGLGIIGIYVTWPSLHEQKDHAFGPSRNNRRPCHHRIHGRSARLRAKSRKRQIPKATRD